MPLSWIKFGGKPQLLKSFWSSQPQPSELSLSIYIYGTLTPSHKSGKKSGKVSGSYVVCRSAGIMYKYVTYYCKVGELPK